MSSELQPIDVGNPLDNTKSSVFTQTGDKNMQVAHANSVNNINYNIIVPTANRMPCTPAFHSGVRLNTDYYNLFVIGNESFDSGHFIVPKNRALTESIDREIAVRFAGLSDEAIEQIKTFPSLFASENHDYGRTYDGHYAGFGCVTDVKIQENGIKIYFCTISSFPQQRLNELAFSLALGRASSFNELDRTHWTIKRINLLEELRVAGISVLVTC